MSLIMIQISLQPYFSQNISFCEKAPSTKLQGLQMSLFDLSQTCQKAFPENC